MAMIFDVVYPSGERTFATGYPDTIVVVQQVPPGPESCLYDQLEVDFANISKPLPCRVLRVVGGPRRPTHRVRVVGGEVARTSWMDEIETKGWSALDGHDPDPDVVWVVAMEDGLDPATLGDVIPR
jgi:hypothetical protein